MATILEFWKQQLAIYNAQQKSAQTDLTNAQQRLAKAKDKLEADIKELAKIGTTIAAKRVDLAAADPPDAEAILTEIVALIIKQRAQHGIVMDGQDELEAAKAEVAVADATVSRAKASSGSTKARVDAAEASDSERTKLKAAIGKAPLKTLKSTAATLLTSATSTNAKKRIGKNFPAELQTIADMRRVTRVGRLASLEADLENAADTLGTGQAADSGLAGKVLQKRLAFQRAQAALTTYVTTAANRFDQAKAVLTKLEAIELAPAGTVSDVLTASEIAQLQALKAKGAAAEPAAEGLDKNLNDLFAAESALAAQMLTSIEADVDKLDSDTDISKKQKAVEDARKTFADNLKAFAKKADLDLWQAAVPDAGWSALLRYLDAVATLNELKAIDPAGLANALDTAEDDYTKTLALAEISARRAGYFGDEIELRQSLLTAARATIAARLPGAIRGDSY